MTGNVIHLLRIDLIRNLGIQAILQEKDPKRKARNISILAAIGFVAVVMAGYCFALSFGLGMVGISYVTPGYAMTISGLVVLLFTFFKTNGVLFAGKDYEMLMAFPFKTTEIVTAKFLSMYLNNLVFTILVMLPMGIGYAIWNPVTPIRVIIWMLVILLTPLFPMTLAAVAGSVIAALTSKAKHQPILQLLFTALLLVGILGGSFWMQNEALKDEAAFYAMLLDLGKTISEILHRIYPLSAWFDDAINGEQILSFFWFCLLSLAVVAAFVCVCAKYYMKINGAMRSHHAKSNYKMGELKSNGFYMAIVKKEAKKFFSSSIYMLNMGIGLVIAIVFAVACLVMGIDRVLQGMDIPGIENMKSLITVLVPFIIAMLVNMSNTTAVTLSLEGKQLWIVKSLPMTEKMLIQGKMLFNIILVLPVSLFCSLILSTQLHSSLLMVLLYLIFSVASVLFSTVCGSWINLHFPNYKWQNEVEVIKQGMASMLAIIGGMFGYLLLAAAAAALSNWMAGEVVLSLMSAVLLAAAALIYRGLGQSRIGDE